MAADGKLLQGQVTAQPETARDVSAVEAMLTSFLRALATEGSAKASLSVLDRASGTNGQSSAPQRLRDLGGRKP